MNFTCIAMRVHIQSESSKLNAQRALDAKLHMGKSGVLLPMLQIAAKKSNKTPTISIATVEKEDIGVCLINRKGHLSVYVKPDYRGKGIGEELVNKTLDAVKRNKQTCYASVGANERKSMRFWNRMGIFVCFEEVRFGRIPYRDYGKFDMGKLRKLFRDHLRSSLKKQGFTSDHFLWRYY
jgi:GNAT superfamily N-acetyltransferase